LSKEKLKFKEVLIGLLVNQFERKKVLSDLSYSALEGDGYGRFRLQHKLKRVGADC
jgi:hypothetical protein